MKYLVGVLLLFCGCCTYHGKFVSRKEGEEMKKMGMHVQCP